MNILKNGNVSEYRVELVEGNEYIAIKDFDGIRYGSFSKNRDIMTMCVTDHILIDLLNKLEEFVKQKSLGVAVELKKFF